MLDLDNTIADREGAFLHWLETILRTSACVAPGVRRACIEMDEDGQRPRAEFLSLVRERLGLRQDAEAMLSEYRRLTLAAFPPVEEATRSLLSQMRAAGWKVALVTNGDAGVQEATAERIGLTSLLDACIVSGAVGERKPGARIFEIAAEACGEPLRGGWMIGDADTDVEGAVRAGARAVWIRRGREWTRSDCAPAHIAGGIRDALEYVRRSRPADSAPCPPE